MYLRRFHLADYLKPTESAATYPEMGNAIKVCCVCENDDPNAFAEVLGTVESMSKEEKAGFRRGMATVLKLAAKGTLPSEHFDTGSCHNAHTFTHKTKTHKIKGVRNADLRILYFETNDRILLVTDAFPKHKKKLTNGQKQLSEDIVKAFLDADKHVIVNPNQ